jgi:hypothetical protein
MPAASERLQPNVGDTFGIKKFVEYFAVEMRELARAGIASYVGDCVDTEFAQE